MKTEEFKNSFVSIERGTLPNNKDRGGTAHIIQAKNCDILLQSIPEARWRRAGSKVKIQAIKFDNIILSLDLKTPINKYEYNVFLSAISSESLTLKENDVTLSEILDQQEIGTVVKIGNKNYLFCKLNSGGDIRMMGEEIFDKDSSKSSIFPTTRTNVYEAIEEVFPFDNDVDVYMFNSCILYPVNFSMPEMKLSDRPKLTPGLIQKINLEKIYTIPQVKKDLVVAEYESEVKKWKDEKEIIEKMFDPEAVNRLMISTTSEESEYVIIEKTLYVKGDWRRRAAPKTIELHFKTWHKVMPVAEGLF